VCQVDKEQIQSTKINNTFLFNGIIYRNSYEKEEDNREMYLTKQMKGCGSKANEVDGSESELESRNRKRIFFRDFDMKDCSK
jgi:hypothetical protein